MAGPTDDGGMRLNLPDGEDTARDMIGLIIATLRGDEQGQAAILANTDVDSLVRMLATTLAAILAGGVRADPDAPPSALTDEQLHAIEAILVTGITGPGDEDVLGP